MAKHAKFSPSKLTSMEKCIRFVYDSDGQIMAASEGGDLHEYSEKGWNDSSQSHRE